MESPNYIALTEKRFIIKYNTQEKCDAFRKTLGDREYEIYWKDAGGIVIRDSEADDLIGNRKTYATIQLCDMISSDGYDDYTHIYKFAVFLYEDETEKEYTMFDTIEEAFEGYLKACKKVLQNHFIREKV